MRLVQEADQLSALRAIEGKLRLEELQLQDAQQCAEATFKQRQQYLRQILPRKVEEAKALLRKQLGRLKQELLFAQLAAAQELHTSAAQCCAGLDSFKAPDNQETLCGIGGVVSGRQEVYLLICGECMICAMCHCITIQPTLTTLIGSLSLGRFGQVGARRAGAEFRGSSSKVDVPPMAELVIYGRDSCGMCTAFKKECEKNKLKYRYANIEDAAVKTEMFRKVRACSWFKGGRFGLPLVDVYGTIQERPSIASVLEAQKKLPKDEAAGYKKCQLAHSFSCEDGTLQFAEMKKMLQSLNSKLSEIQIQKLFCQADVNQNGTVELDEFIDFVMHGKQAVAKVMQELP
eukprot:s2756_g4.t1